MIKKKLVATRSAELTALEENADLRCGAVLIIGQDLHDHRYLARCVAFENDMLKFELFAPDSRAFLDRALNRVSGHALPARFLDHRREARVARGIAAAHLRGHHDFLHQFADSLAFLQTRHFPLGVQPLTTHASFYPAGELVASVARPATLCVDTGMDLELENKTAFVSGSTAGIGLAIARRLAREGADVTVNGRTEERVEKAVARIKNEVPKARIHGIAGDLSSEQGCAAVVRQLPQVDVLVNNLGIFEPKPFERITDEEWEHFFAVNVLSGVRLSRAYLSGMKERTWGRIVFISSESALQIPAEMIHYGTTKTAQLAIARGLAETCAGTRVTVNSVLPGPTASEGVTQFVGQLAQQNKMSPEEFEKDFFQNARPTSLLQRFLEPDEIASVVAFVCSPLAAAINGASVRADGGVIKSLA